ncbi:MAG: hypothetical protein A4E49_03446 [Methanosaeta sp. PtaU1.Bin112]|nr:MAG: hypothetical protein A4E49_03446 [Methanosaeta sp. PtaU1.Bin112]
MVSYCRIRLCQPTQRITCLVGFFPGPASWHQDQILVTPRLFVPLDIPSRQEWLDQLSALRILRNQPRPCGLIDDESLIEPCEHSPVDLPAHVLTQGHATGSDLGQQSGSSFIGQRPAFIIERTLVKAVMVLSDVLSQVQEVQCLYLRHLETRPGGAFFNANYAGIGSGSLEDLKVSKVDYLPDALLFQPMPQRCAIVGPHPLVGHDVGEDAASSEKSNAALNKVGVEVRRPVVNLVVLLKIALELAQALLPYIRRIAYHHIKPAPLEDLGELPLPVEWIDPGNLLRPQARIALQDVPAYERVTAFDIISQVRQRPFCKELELLGDRLLVLPLQHLQQQRELGHLHRLPVYVHSEDAIQQNALSLRRGQLPFPAPAQVNGGLRASGLPALRRRGRREELLYL